jgi:hypothetical protein
VPEPVRAQDSDDVTGGFGEDAWKEYVDCTVAPLETLADGVACSFLIAQAKQQNSGGGGCVLM